MTAKGVWMALTIRQNIARLITRNPLSQEEICSTLLLNPAETLDHLIHLQRSLKGDLLMEPARCRACGFSFTKRVRLSPPSRCPKCKGQRIAGPWFSVND
jgi:predicted Zn-ribbon and HTH transcriptional regulator